MATETFGTADLSSSLILADNVANNTHKQLGYVFNKRLTCDFCASKQPRRNGKTPGVFPFLVTPRGLRSLCPLSGRHLAGSPLSPVGLIARIPNEAYFAPVCYDGKNARRSPKRLHGVHERSNLAPIIGRQIIIIGNQKQKNTCANRKNAEKTQRQLQYILLFFWRC